ncbi:hypothetical protein [Dinghuibacter silviterrae]|uniref:Uncharacterized protein n=1 Tax=Dinghuibacter silviterrae TaxID=1539049 RepID=A0A4R8DQH3_9BACT|nr:hypothetical protein [Dinghuibacter silviterrae]TDX00400.1 hypothetical protein EDB95_1423 [Dinghuibacter silviterrae]
MRRWLWAMMLGIPSLVTGQSVFSTFATKTRREAFYQNFLKNYVQRDLTLPLADSTEDDWADPFYGLELLHYKTPFVQQRIAQVWDHVDERSGDFLEAYLQLLYTNYPHSFRPQVKALLQRTLDNRVFILCAEYLLLEHGDAEARTLIRQRLAKLLDSSADVSLELFRRRLNHEGVPSLTPPLDDLLGPSFQPGKTVVYSFQRSNRDYPGLAVIRGADGLFVRNPDSTYFAVPQLARSITNLPYYTHDGNTPQGIFLMDGFGFSHNEFLGPTLNIQMRMPYEVTPAHFFHDPGLTDTTWYLDAYKALLPPTWREDFAMQGAFYAGRIGRRAVIAHGTTIDPNYFKGSVWYPQTPSLGCLCTHERWDDNGQRVFSDQQKLVNALDSAGGAEGYLVVVELDDWPGPVTLADVGHYLAAADKAAAFGKAAVYLHHHGAHHSTGRTNAAHTAG